MRNENGSFHAAMTPSLSGSSSSGSPTRSGESLTHGHRSASPIKLDTAVINGTPLFTPSPVVRRTLTYSPTKCSNTWSQRIIFVLIGCIFMSVLMTMLATILLLDDGDSDRGLTFGTPTVKIPEHPHVRGGGFEHNVSISHVQETTGNGVDATEPAVVVPDRVTTLNNVVSIVKNGDEQTTEKEVVPEIEGIVSKPGVYPRVIFYDVEDPPPIRTERALPDDPMLHAPPGFEAAPQDRMKPDYTQGDCVPMHDWQTKSFPNCNLVHEYDMKAAGPRIYKNNTNLVLEDTMLLLGQGWFRHTWRLNTGASDESVVLKTLRLEREFYDEYYDLHRRDAVAMERLTHSPFIMDIFGYCGQSAINELADFGKGLLASLEKVDRKMRGKDDPVSYMLKLQLGASVAVGVAHIHEIDDDDRPSMVHYDLNPRNIAIINAGKPKINDFNIAEFLHWNPSTNETCGFPSRLHEPWWRAPEEVSLTPSNNTALKSEVDVYALGNILFHVLTTHSPRGKMNKKERAEGVREKVLRGEPPFLDKKYRESKDPSIVAFRKAMKLCFEPDPKKRGTARQVADIMLKALMEQKKKRKARNAKKKGHR